jgi:hypothetical protein
MEKPSEWLPQKTASSLDVGENCSIKENSTFLEKNLLQYFKRTISERKKEIPDRKFNEFKPKLK